MFLPHNRKRFELMKKQKEAEELKQKQTETETFSKVIPEIEITKSNSSVYEDDNVSVFSNEDLVSYQSIDNIPYMIDEEELQLVNPDMTRKFIYLPKGDKLPKKKTYKPKLRRTECP